MNNNDLRVLNDKDLLAVRDKHLQRAQAVFRGEAVKPVLNMNNTVVPNGGYGSMDDIDIMNDPELWVRCVLDKLALVAFDAGDETTLRLLVVNCIASLFSSRFMDKLFGSEVWYDGQTWEAHELPTEVGTLKYPDLDKHPAYIALERAIREFKKADVKLPYFMPPAFGGPLNTAVNLYGSRFLEAIYDYPKKVRHDLRIITDVTADLYRRMLRLVPENQLFFYYNVLPGYGVMAGCTTQLLSPDMYREVFMPFQEDVYAELPNGYVIHICGSSLQHIPSFREMKNLRGIELCINKNIWEHFEQYYQGLRDDQVVFLANPAITPESDFEILNQIEHITDGRRIVVHSSIFSEKPPADAEIRKAMYCGNLLSDIRNGWMFKTDEKNEGEKQQWFLGKPDSQWRPISIDRSWTQQGCDYHGVAWYSVAVPPVAHVDQVNRIYLVFRAVDGYATVWINGVKAGEQLMPPGDMWDRAWGLDVTDQVKKADRGFQLTVKVAKENCAAGIWRPVELRSVKQ